MAELVVPGVAFMIASSPATFKVTRKVFGSWVGNFEGVATPAGLFLHMLFFLLVLRLTGKYLPMVFARVSGFETQALCQTAAGTASSTCAQDDSREKKWYYTKPKLDTFYH
jgi:hypothetical protein